MYCGNILTFQKSKWECMNCQEMSCRMCVLLVKTLSESLRITGTTWGVIQRSGCCRLEVVGADNMNDHSVIVKEMGKPFHANNRMLERKHFGNFVQNFRVVPNRSSFVSTTFELYCLSSLEQSFLFFTQWPVILQRPFVLILGSSQSRITQPAACKMRTASVRSLGLGIHIGNPPHARI